MIEKARHAIFLFLEKCLRWCILPRLRAKALGVLGAKIGRNVRVCECQFINLRRGFSNLSLADDVYIGPGCVIDLENEVILLRGTTLSPRVTILTHSDPGSFHGSPLVGEFPAVSAPVRVGEHCWIGAGSTVLCGVQIGSGAVVGAMALVKDDLIGGWLYAGIPVHKIRPIGTLGKHPPRE